MFYWKYILAVNDILKENYKQIVLYRTYVCSLSHCEMFWKIIASDKNHLNNCTVSHITLKLHKLTGWFIITCMDIAQLLKHFRNVIGR